MLYEKMGFMEFINISDNSNAFFLVPDETNENGWIVEK